MKKNNRSAQPLSHRSTRTFLQGVTGVILASSLSFSLLGFAGCAPEANATASEVQAEAAADGGAEDGAEQKASSGDRRDLGDRNASKTEADVSTGDSGETADDASDDAAVMDASEVAAGSSADSSADATFESVAAAFDAAALDLEYSNRDTDATYDAASATTISLSGTGAEVSGEGVNVTDGWVTITAEGTYVLSGSLEGTVEVDAPDTAKVQLVLDGAAITNASGAALVVKQADKCFVTLADGSENTLEDGADYALAEGEDEPNAALFSKEDLTINGSGKLTVKGNYRHGIASKDDLVITGGTLDVTAVENGLRGKDCVKIKDGTFVINAGEDGIKSNNDSDATRGFVSIDGGSFDITAGDEGIQAKTYLRIAGGDFTINAADDALHSDLEGVLEDGMLVITAGDDAFHAETILTLNGGDVVIRDCVEGYEAEKIYVNDGAHYIVASDDAVNAAVADLSGEESAAGQNGDFDIAAGTGAGRPGPGQSGEFQNGERPARPDMFDEATSDSEGEATLGERAEVPDENATANGDTQGRRGKSRDRWQNVEGGSADQSAAPGEGEMAEPPTQPEDVPSLPEGEAAPGERPDGEFFGEPPAGGRGVPTTPGASDAADDQGVSGDFGGRGGFGGFGGPGGMAGSSTECLLQINGGYLWVDAQGDGLDSNGSIEINGGTVLVNGPSNDGNGGLDYEFSADVNGGNVLILGSAGMAEDFSETSTQPFVAASVSGQSGDTVALVDADGNVLLSVTATKSFQMVQASSESLIEGQTYTIVVGGTIEGTDEMGFVNSGTVAGGTSTTVTASTTPSGIARGMMGGRGGRF